MTLLGQSILSAAGKKNAPLRKWLAEWAVVVQKSNWRSLIDLRSSYPSADGVQAKRKVVTVFNVKGNEYRLIVVVDYSAQIVIVGEVITHAEYSKDLWKESY